MKKSIGKIFLFSVILLVVTNIIEFLFVPSSYLRVAMHEIQSEDTNYDLIFYGQSLGETNINPFIVEEKTGIVSYNLCRRLIYMPDMLYQIKESNYGNDLKYLVLHVDPGYWYNTDIDYYCDSYIYPHLNNPQNKVEYFFRYCLKNDFRVAFCRYVVQGMGDIKNCKERVQQKLSPDYCNYSIDAVSNDGDYYDYVGRGFRYGVKYSEEVETGEKWDRRKIDEEVLKSFDEIMQYCNENDIKVVAITSPFPEWRISGADLDDFNQFYSEYFEQYDVEFLDFNYIKDEYLTWDDKDFQDGEGHMMGPFAERYSLILGEVLNQTLSGNSVQKYFDKEIQELCR